MKPRSLLTVALTLLLALAAACGPAATPAAAPAEPTSPPAEATEAPAEPTEAPAEPTEAPAEAEPVELTFWFEGEAPATVEIFETAFDGFEAAHPGVTVTVIPIPFEEMVRTLPLALDGGTGPDAATVPSVSVGTWLYVEAGHLTDLTDIAAERGWLDRVDPRAIAFNNAPFDGRVYGIPYEWTGVGVYYNKDLFAELGLEVPTTLAEFEQVMADILAAGYVPVSVGARDAWPLQHAWSQLAHTNLEYERLEALETPDPEARYDTPELVAAAAKIVEWAEAGYLDPNMLSTSFVDANNLFVNGEAAMNFGGTWVQADFRLAEFEVGFFPTPPMNPDLPYHMGGFAPYDDMVVVKGGPHEELAIELLDYLVSAENMTYFWQNGLLVPYLFDELPAPKDQLQVDIFSAMQNSGGGHYEGNCCPEVQQTIWAKMQEMVAGDVTPEQAMADIQTAYEEYVAANP